MLLTIDVTIPDAIVKVDGVTDVKPVKIS